MTHLGLLPIRAYALCILARIIAAVLVTRNHMITDPELYFAAGKQPLRALLWVRGHERAKGPVGRDRHLSHQIPQ